MTNAHNNRILHFTSSTLNKVIISLLQQTTIEEILLARLVAPGDSSSFYSPNLGQDLQTDASVLTPDTRDR